MHIKETTTLKKVNPGKRNNYYILITNGMSQEKRNKKQIKVVV